MNPVAIVHFFAALLVIGLAMPLIRRKVRMNHAYGVRIAAAFESDAAWFDINHYGGRLFLAWGVVFAVTAMVGALLERRYWATYNWVCLVPILGGLAAVSFKIRGYARRYRR